MAAERVMISGNVDDRRALASLSQHLLDDVVVHLRPEPPAAQLPAVHDIADQIKALGFGVTQEVEQPRRLAGGAAEVQIGDPDCAEAELAGVIVVHRDRSGCSGRHAGAGPPGRRAAISSARDGCGMPRTLRRARYGMTTAA